MKIEHKEEQLILEDKRNIENEVENMLWVIKNPVNNEMHNNFENDNLLTYENQIKSNQMKNII
jgi:hypothetical protein